MAKIDIDARIKRLEEQLKSAKNQKAKSKAILGKKEAKKQNKKDILYAIYRRQLHAEEYKKDISSSDFDKFLVRDYERELFGFTPLKKDSVPQEDPKGNIKSPDVNIPSETETKTSVNLTNEIPERVYLDVDIKYKDIAKKHGAKWDSEKVKWYAPKGVEPQVIYDAIESFKASQKVMPAKSGSFEIPPDTEDL